MVAIIELNEKFNGKEIGAFSSDGKLVGATVAQNGKAALVIYGEDEFNKKAASDGELITFRTLTESNNFSIKINNAYDVINKDEFAQITYKKDAVLSAKAILDEGISNEEQVKALPNPASNSFNLEFNLNDADNYEILIYSSTGMLIDKISDYSAKSGVNYFNYNSSHLSSGLYNVIIRGTNYLESCKVVIVK